MTIAHIQPFAQRTTQGTKLSSQQHDDIHESMRQTINAIIDQLNEANAVTGALPAGISLEWAGTTLPSGRYLWENGIVLSRALYPDLFAAIGTTYNVGGETGSEFRLPNRMGKVAICANPLNGQTDGSLSTYTLADIVGAETNEYTPTVTINTATLTATPTGTVTLSPYTPSGSLLINGVTATGTVSITPFIPTGTVSLSAYTPSGTVTVDNYVGTAAVEVLEVTLPYTPTGTLGVTLTNGAVSGTGSASVTGASCVNASTSDLSVMACDSPLVVSISDIAAGLTTNVSVNTQTFTGDATNFDHYHDANDVNIGHGHTATFTGVASAQTATFTGGTASPTATFTGNTVAVTGTFTGVASTQTATFVGASQNLNHTHTGSITAFDVSTIQPAIVKNFIITY